jgi:hypothetical protein
LIETTRRRVFISVLNMEFKKEFTDKLLSASLLKAVSQHSEARTESGIK